MFPEPIDKLTRTVLETARARGLTIGAAESCTGGLVAAALCAIPGASDVFDRGFVTYSNAAKQQALDVPSATLEVHGAVSEATARAMAAGVLAHSSADLAISTTGIAGPGGGSPEKPVGLVHIAVARRDGAVFHRRELFGPQTRPAIQMATVEAALTMLLEAIG
jgi:nicotinamide-nucleotide amidase